jgi:hypothetical protein
LIHRLIASNGDLKQSETLFDYFFFPRFKQHNAITVNRRASVGPTRDTSSGNAR